MEKYMKLTDNTMWTLKYNATKLNKCVTKISTHFNEEEILIGNKDDVEELRKEIIDIALSISTNLNYMEYE